jgi:hypothetical protein
LEKVNEELEKYFQIDLNSIDAEDTNDEYKIIFDLSKKNYQESDDKTIYNEILNFYKD